MDLILANELTNRPLFVFAIEASYVEADHCDFLQLLFLLVILSSPVETLVLRSFLKVPLASSSLLVRR